jgi:molybdate transport repressor ModE-like protein
MKVELRLGGLISVNGREVALGQTSALLEGIARERSVTGAADRLGLSYRSAWGRMAELEAAIGRPVALKTKGHGTVLTELGDNLRQTLQATLKRFESPLAREQRALEQRLADLVGTSPGRLTIAASHDPLLVETLSRRGDVEVSVMGSEVALDRLLAGKADVAGCHFGPSENGDRPAPLRDPGVLAHPAFEREQGLIVAKGNPIGLRSIADLAGRKARFINRQRGSGTRAWFDRMLAAERIAPADITGYGVEEFTHQAVAAVVASGAADVGFGVRAAAEAFGLTFVPLGRETYYLVHREAFSSPVLDEIMKDLRSRPRARAPGRARRRVSG